MTEPRWSDYYFDDNFISYWTQRAKDIKTNVLVMIGLGFDPRCLSTLKSIAQCGLGERLSYIVLKLVSRPSFGKSRELMDELSQKNLSEFSKIQNCKSRGIFSIDTHDNEGHYVGGRTVLKYIANNTSLFAQCTDIIVDISGMPRGIFFPLVNYLIHQSDDGKISNLHVAVVEDPELDACISGREYGHADYLHTFRNVGENKTIWLPLISTNEEVRMTEIQNKLKSNCIEICPIIPFPAESLRRVDDILVKHADTLFEGFQVSQNNIILCDEHTPFDVYRKIIDVDAYYKNRLSDIPSIGPVTTVVSPLSSKTLSLGMLLAAVERKLPVCHVEPGTIEVDDNRMKGILPQINYSPKEIWLTGEPYLP